MMIRGAAKCLRVWLAIVVSVPFGFSQTANTAANNSAQASADPGGLSITILEGNHAVNSLAQVHSIPPVVEIHDLNEFPVEGAIVVFTLPDDGPGGIFTGGERAFTTRSDARGQAAAPFFTPKSDGKFIIKVTAAAGSRKVEGIINQTNSLGEYSGPPIPRKPVYKKRLPIILALSGAAAVGVAVALLAHKSGSSTTSTPSTITITPGSPVFH